MPKVRKSQLPISSESENNEALPRSRSAEANEMTKSSDASVVYLFLVAMVIIVFIVCYLLPIPCITDVSLSLHRSASIFILIPTRKNSTAALELDRALRLTKSAAGVTFPHFFLGWNDHDIATPRAGQVQTLGLRWSQRVSTPHAESKVARVQMVARMSAARLAVERGYRWAARMDDDCVLNARNLINLINELERGHNPEQEVLARDQCWVMKRPWPGAFPGQLDIISVALARKLLADPALLTGGVKDDVSYGQWLAGHGLPPASWFTGHVGTFLPGEGQPITMWQIWQAVMNGSARAFPPCIGRPGGREYCPVQVVAVRDTVAFHHVKDPHWLVPLTRAIAEVDPRVVHWGGRIGSYFCRRGAFGEALAVTGMK
jgi:hypothetical protein